MKDWCVLYFVSKKKKKKPCSSSVSLGWSKKNKKNSLVRFLCVFISFHLHFLLVPGDLVCDWWGFCVSAQEEASVVAVIHARRARSC